MNFTPVYITSIITVLTVIFGVMVSYAAIKERNAYISQWVQKHDSEAAKRDTHLSKLDIAITELKELTKYQERRLKFIEDRCMRPAGCIGEHND